MMPGVEIVQNGVPPRPVGGYQAFGVQQPHGAMMFQMPQGLPMMYQFPPRPSEGHRRRDRGHSDGTDPDSDVHSQDDSDRGRAPPKRKLRAHASDEIAFSRSQTTMGGVGPRTISLRERKKAIEACNPEVTLLRTVSLSPKGVDQMLFWFSGIAPHLRRSELGIQSKRHLREMAQKEYAMRGEPGKNISFPITEPFVQSKALESGWDPRWDALYDIMPPKGKSSAGKARDDQEHTVAPILGLPRVGHGGASGQPLFGKEVIHAVVMQVMASLEQEGRVGSLGEASVEADGLVARGSGHVAPAQIPIAPPPASPKFERKGSFSSPPNQRSPAYVPVGASSGDHWQAALDGGAGIGSLDPCVVQSLIDAAARSRDAILAEGVAAEDHGDQSTPTPKGGD